MIRIAGHSDHNDENQAAIFLKEAFLRWRPDLETNKDQILILVAVQAFGNRGNQDIDLVVLARLSRPLEISWRFPNQKNATKVLLWSFCATVEVKGHSARRHDGTPQVRFHDNQVDVLYGTSEWHSASLQALGQGKSLKARLQREIGVNFYVVSFLWLFRISAEQVSAGANEPNNILPNVFDVEKFATKLLDLDYPVQDKAGHYRYAIWVRDLDFDLIAKRLLATYEPTSLDRAKIDSIIKRRIDFKQFEALGERQQLVIGRAGSGKTMILLRVALELFQIGKRVTILTYNKCLIADVGRLLMIMKVTGASSSANVNICTLHAYFLAVIKSVFPDEEVTGKQWFDEIYPSRMLEIVEMFRAGAATRSDIKTALIAQEFPVFEVACVDEGQDWLDAERDLLHYTVGSENCIAATGFDQLVRQDRLCDWTSGGSIPTGITRLRRCLRMKSALATFANVVAQRLGLTDWEVEPDDDVIGGKVIIAHGNYSAHKSLHKDLLNSNAEAGNQNIDMLFCVGPGDMWPHGSELGGARLATDLKTLGQDVWDATLDDNRADPPRSVTQCRIVQYESCRGLEGWIVVAEHLDQFFDNKVNSHRPSSETQARLFSDGQADAIQFAALWSMIPLTRAIDTILITIQDPGSQFGRAAMGAAEQLPDVVTVYGF